MYIINMANRVRTMIHSSSGWTIDQISKDQQIIEALRKRNADLEASAENAKKARVVADALERGEPVPVVAIVPVVATAGAAIVANMPTMQQLQQFNGQPRVLQRLFASWQLQLRECGCWDPELGAVSGGRGSPPLAEAGTAPFARRGFP